MVNMMATFLTFGCIAGSGVAVFSLMGNGKKIEGYFLCGVWCGVGGLCSVVSCGVLWCPVLACRVLSFGLQTAEQSACATRQSSRRVTT
jgi:hypothetical protein